MKYSLLFASSVPPRPCSDYGWARAEHAWLLRAEGLLLAEVGARLGLSRGGARRLIFVFSQRMQRAMRHARWSRQ